jgi:FkbM family methyltransferase
MDVNGFDWGVSSNWYRETIFKEIFKDKIYEKFFSVEPEDIVVDLGASIGPFPYTIKDKNPKHIYCLEPSSEQIPTLIHNLNTLPATVIPKGISSKDGEDTFELYGSVHTTESALSISFNSFIKENNINTIHFLKTDCEGGEYDVFNLENIWWVKQNVKKIVGEWHLGNSKQKNLFRKFRDLYLKTFTKFEIYSVDGVDIKWDLWNEHFIEYYTTILIYIDNR